MALVYTTTDGETTDFLGSTVQDTLFCSALSNASGMPDFKYVFDVYANGNQLTRVKLYPDPINARGYFDAGPSVRNEMDYGWVTASMITSDDAIETGAFNRALIVEPNQTGQIAINYDIRFGEEYISGGAYVSGTYVSGGTLVTLLNQASGTRKVYNYSAAIFNRKSISINSFNGKFLTNRPKKANCKIDDDLLISSKVSAGANIYIGFKIVQYNQSNTAYRTFNQYTDYPTYTQEMYEFYQVNIGPNALNALLTLASKPLITESTKYYDVNLINIEDGTDIGEKFRVYLDCNPKYDSIDLHFMNQWGMLDTARFDLASRLTMDIERKSFAKNDYYNLGATKSFFPRQETKINYGSKINWTYKLTMNYPTDEEYVWLSELIASPIIYANLPEITDGYPMPVTIKNTNYEYSTNQNNGLKVLEIEVELNQTRYGFLR
jgi:hypothetical protein